MYDEAHIQLQDGSGMWRTYTITINQSQKVLMEMQNLKRNHPNLRVRAVDKNGRVIDILG
jgi:ribulose bisphosphate carboxylase small subunit